MSLGKRLLHLARANVSAILGPKSTDLDEYTDDELRTELESRDARRRREDGERAARREAERKAEERARARGASTSSSAASGASGERAGRSSSSGPSGASGSTSGPSGGGGARPATARGADLAFHYAQLETPVGADFATVKRNFRRLMRLHHPDLHSHSPEAHRAATERAKRLTVAYEAIERARTS